MTAVEPMQRGDLLLVRHLEQQALPVLVVTRGELPAWMQQLPHFVRTIDAEASNAGERAVRGHVVVVPEALDGSDGPVADLVATMAAAGNQIVHRHGASWRVLPRASTARPRRFADWLARMLPRVAARFGRLPLRPPFRDDGGHARWASLRGLPAPAKGSGRCVMLLENDRPLPFPDSVHDEIRQRGGGRYSVWNDGVYFSASDGSDPASNGRRYEARVVTPGDDGELVATALDEESFARRFVQLAASRDASTLTLAPKNAAKNPPRVLIVISSLGPGGAERQFAYLAKGLAARGHAVAILSLDGFAGAAGHYLPMLHGSGVELLDGLHADARCTPSLLAKRAGAEAMSLLHVLPELFAADVWRIAAHVAVFAPDVLHCALDKPNLMGAIAGVCLAVPRIVLSTRNVNPSHLPYLDQPWFRRWYRLASEVPGLVLSANSHAGGEDYAQWLELPAGAVRVVHNGLDTSAIRVAAAGEVEALRRELRVPDGARVLVSVFRLSAEKRPFLWLDTVAALRRQFPELIVVHVGLGALTERVAARIAELGLGDCVQLLGRRTDTEVVLRMADLFLLCSEFEGIPNVLLEAQWLERPVVCTAAGGSAEAVVDGVTGSVVMVAEAAPLAAACARLLGDGELRARMGAAGRQHVATAFAVSRMIEGSVLLYE